MFPHTALIFLPWSAFPRLCLELIIYARRRRREFFRRNFFAATYHIQDAQRTTRGHGQCSQQLYSSSAAFSRALRMTQNNPETLASLKLTRGPFRWECSGRTLRDQRTSRACSAEWLPPHDLILVLRAESTGGVGFGSRSSWTTALRGACERCVMLVGCW